jgi:hypothetical protein
VRQALKRLPHGIDLLLLGDKRGLFISFRSTIAAVSPALSSRS